MLGDCGVAEDVRNVGCSLLLCGLKQIDTAFFEDDCAAISLVLAIVFELVLQV
uniref:Uncharacterized protein n=1 Tax=Arundo donax TaxID=35708 RepID=A0A0A9BBT1_ARUDO